MPASFRPLEAADLDTVVAFMAKLYASAGSSFDTGRARRATERLLGEPQSGGVWLVEEEGAIAGYIVLVLGYSLEFNGRYGLLDELFIDDRFRGRGLGAAAIAFAESQSRDRGWHAVRLEVGQSNRRAVDLYQRSGFHLHSRFLMTKWI